jgi:hypothetical protein
MDKASLWSGDRGSLALHITVRCMRRFACTNFQIITKLDSKLSYTPCYMQCGFNLQLNRSTESFCFIFVGGNLKFEYLYIK